MSLNRIQLRVEFNSGTQLYWLHQFVVIRDKLHAVGENVVTRMIECIPIEPSQAYAERPYE